MKDEEKVIYLPLEWAKSIDYNNLKFNSGKNGPQTDISFIIIANNSLKQLLNHNSDNDARLAAGVSYYLIGKQDKGIKYLNEYFEKNTIKLKEIKHNDLYLLGCVCLFKDYTYPTPPRSTIDPIKANYYDSLGIAANKIRYMELKKDFSLHNYYDMDYNATYLHKKQAPNTLDFPPMQIN